MLPGVTTMLSASLREGPGRLHRIAARACAAEGLGAGSRTRGPLVTLTASAVAGTSDFLAGIGADINMCYGDNNGVQGACM